MMNNGHLRGQRYLRHYRQALLWLWLALGMLVLGQFGALAQDPPPNDNLTNAFVLIGPYGTTNGNNYFATGESNETSCLTMVVDPTNPPPTMSSVWYKWNAPGSGYAYFDTHYSTLDTVLTVYEDEATGVAVSDRYMYLWEYDCNDDYPSSGWDKMYYSNSLVYFYAYKGWDYYIRVDGKDGAQGDFQLNWYGLTNVLGPNQIQLTNFTFTVNEDAGFLVIPVEFSGGANGPVSVDYALLDGTAVFGTDYDDFLEPGVNTGTLIFDGSNPYGTSANNYITLWIGDNGYANPPKTFQLLLYNALGEGTTIGSISNAVVTILDNETPTNTSPAGTFSFAVSSTVVYDFESDIRTTWQKTRRGAYVTVTRTNGSTGRVMVDYSTVQNWQATNFWYNGKYYPTNAIGSNSSTTYIPALPYYYYDTNSGYSTYYYGEYYPVSGTLVFDDYQMSAEIYVDTYQATNYYGAGYNGTYSYFNIALSNPRPAPEEEAAKPGFLVPTLGPISNATVYIAHTYSIPEEVIKITSKVVTNAVTNLATTNITYNVTTNYTTNSSSEVPKSQYAFIKKYHRVDEFNGTIGFYVYHFGTIDKDQKVTLRTIDKRPNSSEFGYTLAPGSDYAESQARTHANSAYTDGARTFTDPQDYNSYSTDLEFKKNGDPYQEKEIIINNLAINDKVPEFNEDVEFELAATKDGDPVNSLGSVCTVTILFDDQPAGAADRDWNPADVHFTSPPFNHTPGANNTVNSVFVQHDQKTLIGGNFTTYNGTLRNRIARINNDGMLDESFRPGNGANDSVAAVSMYPYPMPIKELADKIVLGGNFTSFAGVLRNHIARLNADGSLDETFNPGEGANGPVRAVLPQMDGRVIIAGEFTRYNGVARNRIARLNQDGSLDTTFDPGTGADDTIFALGLDTPRPLQLSANRVPANSNLPPEFRTNIQTSATMGRISLSFKPGCEPDTMRVYCGTNLIFESGMVDEYGGVLTNCNTTNYVGPLDYQISYGPGQDSDLTFVVNEGITNGGTPWSFSATIDNLSGMRILAGGRFGIFNGADRNGIVRLLEDGRVDPGFEPGSGTDGAVYALAVQKDSKVLIGGSFSDCDFHSRHNIARFNANGTLDTTFDPGLGFDNAVYAIKLQPDGKPVVGGRFTSYDSVRRMGITRLMTNGVIDTSFMDTAYNQYAGLFKTFSFDPPNFVNSIDLESNTNVMIGGSFTNIGGNPVAQYYYLQDNEYYSGRAISYADSYSRAAKIQRYNVARLIGGYTLGPGVCELDHTSYDANENAGVNTITLRRVDGRLGTIGAYLVPSNRVAQAGIDYIATNAPVVWSEARWVAPDSIGWVDPEYYDLTIINNNIIDGDRSLDLFLMNPYGSVTLGGEYIPLGGGRGRMQVPLNIHNDDFPKGVLAFAQPTYTVNENGGTVTISIIRTNGTDGRVGVTYLTANDSAIAGSDYVPQSGTITLESGETSAKITIPIIDDSIAEFDETFKVVLTNATGGATLPGGIGAVSETALVTIIDNDFAPGRLNFLMPDFTVKENEGPGTVTVTRSGGNLGAISVTVAAYNGTAQSGIDYVAVTNVLRWDNGDTAPKSFPVTIINNDRVDGDRTINLRMLNPSINGIIGNRSTNVTLTILEDDSYGKLAFSHAGYDANENGTNVLITVIRSGGLAGTVNVDYSVLGGSAIAGQDYLLAPGTLTLGPGQSSASFTIHLVNNTIQDGDRTILLGLVNYVNGAPALVTNTVVTIVDDEAINMPAGSLDTAFSPVAGPDKPVYSVLLQTNGNILIGGDFTQVHGIIRNRIAQFLPDGTLDSGFNVGTGPNRPLRAMQLQPDGKILIAGLFTSVDGVVRGHLARLHQDGALDTGFEPGSGTDNPIYSMSLAPDGRILIGGFFTTYNGITTPNLAIVNTNGMLDASFNIGLGPNGVVYASAFDADGKILIGGDFTDVNGISRARIARLNPNGTVDTAFDPGLGANATVRTILVQPDGKILIGGSFTSVNGTNRAYFARLDQQGLLDPSFLDGNNHNTGADDAVYAACLQPDDKIIVVGGFTTFNDVTRRRITRLNPDGTSDPTINFGLGANSFIASVALQPDRKILIGGGFTTFDDQPRNYLARIYGGSIDGAGTVQFRTPTYSVYESQSNAPITIRRMGGLSGNVTVDFNTTPGSAVPNVDYLATNATITFLEGEVLQTFRIPILTNRPFVTLPRTVNLFLTNTTANLVLGPQPVATLSILSDDSIMGFDRPTYGVTENAPSGNILITVRRDPSGATNTAIAVDYSTRDGSAVNGVDYRAVNGTLNFEPGEMYKTFTVPLINDATPRGTRTVIMELLNTSGNVSLAIGSAVLNIYDDDDAIGQLNLSSANYSVNEYETNLVITILRTNGSSAMVTVNYATSDQTANSGVDYIGVSGTKTFNIGETVKTINIPILQNYNNNTNTTFFIILSDATAGATIGNLPSAIVTIINTELIHGSFSFSQTNYSTFENSNRVVVTVNRNFGFQGPASVSYVTYDGTATAGQDYLPVTNFLSWVDGDRTPKSFEVAIVNDDVVENDETFGVRLLNPVNGTLGGLTDATVTIKNDDLGPGKLTFDSNSYTVMENGTNATIQVFRVLGNTGTVSVVYSTSDGTGSNGATNGIHYLGATNPLTFAPGVTNQTILIPVVDRPSIEMNKQFYIQLSSPSGGASLGDNPSAVVTIVESQLQAGSIDPSFNNLGVNGQVNIVVYQTNNNKILAGGDFTTFDNVPRAHLVRINANGSLDTSFDTTNGLNNSVRAIALQPDGKVLVGGSFTSVYGGPNSYFTRLNYDGSLDTNFLVGLSGVDNMVEAIAVQSDKKILIGGQFSTVNGLSRYHIARLQPDGQVDLSFNPNASAEGTVRVLQVRMDNKILVGGDFLTVNGTPRVRLALLDGAGELDSTFDPGVGPDGSVRSAVFYNNESQIIIGGLFQSYNSIPSPRVARLDSFGRLDTSFAANIGSGADEFVSALAVRSNKVVVVGGFNSFNGYDHHRITRLTSTGAVDTSINFGSGANNYISTVALQPDSKIVIGGGFTNFDGVTRYYIARLNDGDNVGQGCFAFSTTNYNVLESGASVSVTVRRRIGTDNTVQVNFATSDGTAFAGLHYISTNGTLTFRPGETIKTFQVAVLYDPAITPDRTINLTLSNPAGGAILTDPSTATIAIRNVDSQIGFAVANYSISENSGLAQITVQRVGSTVGSNTVAFSTADNTAVAGVNYTPTNGTLVFLDGQSNAVFNVPVINNNVVQDNLLINLALSSPTGPAILGRSTAELMIVEDDYSAGQLTLRSQSYPVTEKDGAILVTVDRVGGRSGQASVYFTTSDGSAVGGFDYIRTNGVLVFADGEVSKTIAIGILNDSFVEDNEVFNVNLYDPVGATLGQIPLASVVILANESVFNLAASSYIVYEASNQVQSVVTVNVNRMGLTNGTASVSLRTSDGTAKAGQDFAFTNLTLIFADGETTKSVPILIFDDTVGEPSEQFYVRLSAPSANAFIGNIPEATVTIIDNDDIFSLSSSNYVVDEHATNAEITIVRSGTPNTNYWVDIVYYTTNMTAAAGTNYTTVSNVISFSPFQMTKSFNVPILYDPNAQGDVTVGITIYGLNTPNTTTFMAPTNAILTILDDNLSVGFGNTAYSVNEGSGSISLDVKRYGSLSNDLTVYFATADISTTSNLDYSPVYGMITFYPGETNKFITIPINDDQLIEGNEMFTVRLWNTNLTNLTFRSGGTANVTIIDNDSSIIVPAGSALVAENLLLNGYIDVGETVTVNFGLRNVGNVPTTDLRATLLATNGIAAPGPAQSYGPVGTSSTVSRPFQFTASTTNGGTITATFMLQDIDTFRRVTNNLGLITYSFVVGQAQQRFASSSSIVIVDATNADPYPSTIVVSNVQGTVSKVSVTLYNFSHSFPSDVDILLVNPQGKATILMSDAGGILGVSGVNLTFDDSATTYIPKNTELLTGTYKPTNYVDTWYGQETVDFWPAPAPSKPWTNCTLSALTGGNPNGEWKLFIVDDMGYNAGAIAGGWAINLMTSGAGTSPADLALVNMSSNPDQAYGSGTITYSVTVENHGPSAASSVYVTNVLPANCAYMGCDIGSSGFISVNNNQVIISLGTLTNGYSKTYHLQVTNNQTVGGNITFMANIGGAETDLNLDNNYGTVVTPVGVPTLSMQWNTGHTALNLAWPASASGYVLEMTDTIQPANWVQVPNYTISGNQCISSVNPTNATKFFRLHKQ